MKKRSVTYNSMIAQEVQLVSAEDADAITFIPRLFTQASLPVRRIPGNEFIRQNGLYELTLLSPSSIGLPYGGYPRMLIVWITDRAKKTRSRHIHLGDSFNDFLGKLEKSNSGGDNGPLKHIKTQYQRLLSCHIQWTHNTSTSWSMRTACIASEAHITWQPASPYKWETHLILSEAFFNEIMERSVPVDKRVLEACSHYPMAFDLYCWLTSRNFYNKKKIFIPWQQLAMQFANTYSRQSTFRSKFSLALDHVKPFYPAAEIYVDKKGVLLYPSPPHVPQRFIPDYFDSS